MAENTLWKMIRETWELMDVDCPDGQRTAAIVHLFGAAETFEANHVASALIRDVEWFYIQTDRPGPPVVRYVPATVMHHVEMRYLDGEKRGVGFTVSDALPAPSPASDLSLMP